MRTVNDIGTVAFGAAIVLSVALAPLIAMAIIPFWMIGKTVEMMIGEHVPDHTDKA